VKRGHLFYLNPAKHDSQRSAGPRLSPELRPECQGACGPSPHAGMAEVGPAPAETWQGESAGAMFPHWADVRRGSRVNRALGAAVPSVGAVTPFFTPVPPVVVPASEVPNERRAI
jgi:hypothetical protein